MEVRVLGPVELVDGATVVRLAPAERTLLAAFASRVGEWVSVDVLEDALWPGRRPASARKTLQGHVLRLRRVLGASAIVERGGGYRLDGEQVDVDACRVTRLVAEAQEASGNGRPDVTIGRLREAQASFRGDPYADVADTALPAGEVTRLSELHTTVAVEAFEAELACGRGQECVAELEAFVEREPYRERAWAQLMFALYQAGRPADALAAYGRARTVLAAELGLEPGPDLRAMERSILIHDPRLLRNVASRVGLGPSNLPAAASPIVGRARELAELDRLLRDHRLLTLTGPGGVGKTRLAVELAARRTEHDEHGPFFVDLVPVGDAGLIPAALAAVLAAGSDPQDDALERVRSALAGHSVVVVIDNCEHLLPGVAELIGALVASSPNVRVLATSREPLDVPGERVWPLDPLGVPPESSAPEEICSSESATLLFARLPTSAEGRRLSIEEVGAVGDICRRLDGMPLGLELAAARSRTLSLPELAERLEHSISELASPGHGVSPRHRSMRAALQWGYRLLSAPAQQALRAMSVFVGGCGLSAFEAVCLDADDQTLDIIDELVRTSFVVVDATETPTRYRQLEPIRQFAAELLDTSADLPACRQRHLRYYCDLARTLNERQEVTGQAPLEPLLRELGNLRAALDWAQDGGETEAGLRLVADMYSVWTGEGHHAEGVARIVALLRYEGGSPNARSRAALYAAIAADHMGDSDHGVALCEQAVHEASRGADQAHTRGARQILTQLLLERGDVDGARRQLTPALPAGSEQAADIDALCIFTDAQIDLVTAELDDATTQVEQILAGPYGRDYWIGTAARLLLGEIMLERGDYDGARRWLADALELAETNVEPVAVIDAHLALVNVECAAGHPDDADAHFRTAAQRRRNTHRLGDLQFLEARAALALNSSTPGDAVTLAAAALALADAMASALHRCHCLRFLGDAQLAAGDLAQARSTFERLIACAGAIPSPCRLAEGHEGAAATAQALGDRPAARRHLDAAAEIRQLTGTQRLPRPAVEHHLVALETGRNHPRPRHPTAAC